MKLIFKIIVFSLFISDAMAQKIIISYHQDTDRRDMVYQVLTERLGLPEQMIETMQSNHPCQRINDAILQICITENAEIFFPVIRRDILKKSFKVFLKEKL